MTKAEKKKLFKIAQENIPSSVLERRDDLERHYCGDEDFLETAVWCLEAALEAAYEMGKAAGQKKSKK